MLRMPVLYAQVGDNVVLKNPVSYQSNKHYMYWTFDDPNNLNIAWSNTFNVKKTEGNRWNITMSWLGDSLTILKIQPKHFGTFICRVTLGSTTNITKYKILELRVTVNPKSLLLPGDSLSLDCGEAKPEKKPKIEWLNPLGQVTYGGQVKVSQVSSQDNGEWTCVVKYDKKQHHAKVSVSVMDLSPAPSQPQYTSKGSRLDIPCSIPSHISWEQIKAAGMQEVQWQFFPKQSSGHVSNNPQLLFSLSPEDPLTWKSHQHRELNAAPELKKGSLSLTRKQGRREDRGNYMCSMKFKNGVSVSRTVHVEALQILSSPGTDLISGQQVNLTCSLGHPVSPDLQLKWSPPAQASHPSLQSDHHPALLIIPHVGTEHRGSWGCALWQGSTKLTSDVIMLKIEPRLSVWMLVIICSAAAIVILLLILVVILCRRRQRKLRHLKHRLCRCKNPTPKGFYRS
uniref:CD4-1 molecule n=1 Tax=Mastacembelus armatus TaxID=205130 RepID=A0A7N9AM95_9TELE